MDKICFLIKNNITYDASISKQTNTVTLTFQDSVPDNLTLVSGFNVLNEHHGENMSGTSYHAYNTIYKVVNAQTVMLSNDGSVCADKEDEKIDTTTLDAMKRAKISVITSEYSNVLQNGLEISLTEKSTRFLFCSDDVLELLNKSLELQTTTVEYIEYKNALYSRQDMLKIISSASYFINKETAYKNNLILYINSLEVVEDVESVSYGQDIPTEFVTELYASYLNGVITESNISSTRVDNLENNVTMLNSELGNTQLAIAEMYELLMS